jgi:nitroreductase
MVNQMNEILTAIKNRRSTRKFKPSQISEVELQAILDAALNAPTAKNQQKWHFTVIQNKVMLDNMVKTIKEILLNCGMEFYVQRARDPNYHTFYKAPTVILISAEEKADFVQLDCAAAAENIILAAESLKIGSCFITATNFLFTSSRGNEFKQKLGIPTGYNFVCTIALGYKDGENPAIPPKNKEVINYVDGGM